MLDKVADRQLLSAQLNCSPLNKETLLFFNIALFEFYPRHMLPA